MVLSSGTPIGSAEDPSCGASDQPSEVWPFGASTPNRSVNV
jgi:hypothetical protein